MPKRKDDSYEYLLKKIRKLDKKLRSRDRRSEHSSRCRSHHTRSSRSRSRHTRASAATPPPPQSPTPPPPQSPTPPPPQSPTPPPKPQSPTPPPKPQSSTPLPQPPTTPPQPPTPQPTVQTLPVTQPLEVQQPPPPQLPPAQQPETTSTATTSQTENKEEQLPEELLLVLGLEGKEHNEAGDPITNELSLRWSKIINEGLTKEQRQALIEKYHIPSNFKAAIPPILNKEIAATLSDSSLNRDKRIVARQKMVGKLLTCLGKTLSDVLKGNINNKNLIQEINDAAKIASDVYNIDNKSRKFFALSNATKAVQEACKDTKTDEYLFGKGLSEDIKSIQAVKRTAAQINKENEKGTSSSKNLNWRAPPQYHQTSHRGRGGQRSTRRPPVTQPPRRPTASRGKYAQRRGNQRRY